MENGGNVFMAMGNRGQNGNNGVSLVWDHMRQINTTTTSRFDWGGDDNTTDSGLNLYATTTTRAGATASSSSVLPEVSAANAFVFLTHHGGDATDLAHHLNQQQHPLYTGDGSHKHPDPHLVCLKLGKRHYFEDSTAALAERHLAIGKRGKPYYSTNTLGGGGGGGGGGTSTAVMGPPAAVPRCQVEGCNVALVNAKDYHRRHKVCEMHSKAPKVVVLGLEQRFCQQCSRFHVVSEFDDSKRSCRRRLAGHNERRRKSSQDSASRNSAQDKVIMNGRFPYRSSSTGRVLSLLSYKPDSWISPSDLSSRSSAALRELIAENRAAIFARQLVPVPDRDWQLHHHAMEDIGLGEAHPPGSGSSLADPHGWDRFHETGAQVTLDLMQASSSAFGMLSVRGKTKDEDEDLWNSCSWGGTHVVGSNSPL